MRSYRHLALRWRTDLVGKRYKYMLGDGHTTGNPFCMFQRFLSSCAEGMVLGRRIFFEQATTAEGYIGSLANIEGTLKCLTIQGSFQHLNCRARTAQVPRYNVEATPKALVVPSGTSGSFA